LTTATPLDQRADAMQQLMAGQVRGKITITIETASTRFAPAT